MAIVTVDDLKAELAFSGDLGDADDALMQGKIDAAQGFIERLLGFKIADQYGDGEGQEPVPAALKEAVCGLAAHRYDARGLAAKDEIAPYWVFDIIAEYREWTF